MDNAIRLLKTRQMKACQANLPRFGVVHASAEIAIESSRRERLQDSLSAEKANFNLEAYTFSVAPVVLSPVGLSEKEAA